jgi:hypothetical protein
MPTMKKLMMLTVFGAMLAGMSGCHVGECWNYAWNSRFHPEKNAPRVQQPSYVVEDSCDGDVVSEPAVSSGCGCGARNVTPNPVMVK